MWMLISSLGGFLGKLLDEAKAYFEAEDDRFSAAWHYWQASGSFEKLNQAAQRLATLAFALAMEEGKLGGPRVILSNRAASRGIALMCGHSYGISTITRARNELAAAGSRR
jgi:hypothetical protein